MDHQTAVKLQATEKYILGELTAAEREEFEEHLSDCSRCMEDTHTADVLAANIRAVFHDRAVQPAATKQTGWLDLLRLRPVPTLAFSGALNLALLAFLIYGAARVVPSLESRLSDYETPHASASFAVRGVSRGAGDVFTVSNAAPNAILRFDLPRQYSNYSYSIQSVAGHAQREGALQVPADADVLNLTIPTAALAPGDYNVKVIGSDGAGQPEEVGSCVLRIEPKK
jgi:hypothetical protein